MTIKRHDCVVDEIYNKIIEVKLNNKYNKKIKWHKLEGSGFLQTGKTLRKIGNFEGNNLKPDIVFCNEEELILIEVAVCFEDLVKNRINQKNEKYEKLFVELIRTYNQLKVNYIVVVVSTSGILVIMNRVKLKDIGIKIE